MLIILLIVFHVSSVHAQCSKYSGPSGTIECIQISRYNNEYQWATCLTDTYIKAKSGTEHECIDRTATYCYYQCMLELYDVNSGPVEGCCKCQQGQEYTSTDLTLPSSCYSPSGTDCGWYENCLEKKYKCKGTDDDYALEFATKFCNLYNEHFSSFSSGGQIWVNYVRKCLQVSLVPIIRPWCSKSCKEIKQIAFDSHIPCYVRPNKQDLSISYCNLNLKDRAKVFWTIKSSLVMKGAVIETLNGVMMTMKECTVQILDSLLTDVKSLLTDIKTFSIEILTEIQSLFRRRRRALSDFTDVLTLANGIADSIANKLRWREQGILWFSSVDSNTSLPLSNELLMFVHLADQKTYDLNTNYTESADIHLIVREFRNKLEKGELKANLEDYSFQPISAKGCLDAQCNITLFDVKVSFEQER
ncbi:unnamed protein product [Mytilus coruscus]|uniref:Uncharacterized protein n=1 Tax=Mytilus coruscus TaxID=42192 RepID=A0A6J8E5Q2_MYTCO|nr:unnamed protein product [Mytilus coruscus]